MDPTLPEAETPPLPELPPNTEMVRPPACFENGVVGWLLYTSERVSLSDYRCPCLPLSDSSNNHPPPPHFHRHSYLL